MLESFKLYLLTTKLARVVLVIFVVAITTAAAADKKIKSEFVADEVKAEADDSLSPKKEYKIYSKERPENPCHRSMDGSDYQGLWYDRTHSFINAKFCEPVLWFDNFFATDRVFEEGVAGVYVRWRNDVVYDEEAHFGYKTRLTASVQLPALENRLRLTFESEADEDLRDIVPSSADESANSLGLQLDFIKKLRTSFSVNVSLKPRIRFRYRYIYPLNERITLRLTQGLQFEESLTTATTRFDFEKLFDQAFLFRATTEGKLSEEYDGVDWLQAVVLYQRINKKTSLSYEASIRGITKPLRQVTDYRLALRLRKNIHRNWLFFEISPEITWPTTYDENRLFIEQQRRSKWQLFFRVEIHFDNAYKKRYQDYN